MLTLKKGIVLATLLLFLSGPLMVRCSLIDAGDVEETYEETVQQYERDRKLYMKIRSVVKEEWDSFSEQEKDRLEEVNSKAKELDEKVQKNIQRVDEARETAEETVSSMRTVIDVIFDWRNIFSTLLSIVQDRL